MAEDTARAMMQTGEALIEFGKGLVGRIVDDMVNPIRTSMSRIGWTFLVAVALLPAGCGEEPAGGASGFGGAVDKRLENTWNARAEIHLTLKDQEGNPISAHIVVSTFAAGGREGVGGGRVVEAMGAAQIELEKVVWTELRIRKDGYDNELLEFDFTDLKDPWEWSPDGKTVVIRRDVTLSPFTERPNLSSKLFHCFNRQNDLYGSGYTVIRRSAEDPNEPWVIMRVPTLDFDSDTSATIYLEYQDDPSELGAVERHHSGIGTVPTFPEGKKIVLRMHSNDESDGFIYTGVRADGFGNHLPVAPEEGYTKSFVLEKEWFLDKETTRDEPILYLKGEGIYGKIRLDCTYPLTTNSDFDPHEIFPEADFSMLSNRDGKRNLRTTW